MQLSRVLALHFFHFLKMLMIHDAMMLHPMPKKNLCHGSLTFHCRGSPRAAQAVVQRQLQPRRK